MKQTINLIITVFICFLTAFLVIRCINYHPQQKVVTEVKYDTVIIYDTIIIEKPIPITRTLTKYINDTVYIENKPILADIPIEEVIYTDERYEAIVSGYKPQLESLKLFQKDTIITNYITERITEKNKSKFSIGIGLGYGITTKNNPTITPIVGLTLNYNLLNF